MSGPDFKRGLGQICATFVHSENAALEDSQNTNNFYFWA